VTTQEINNIGAMRDAEAFAERIGRELERLQPYADAALARGGDPNLIKMLMHEAAMMRQVNAHNAAVQRVHLTMEYHSMMEFVLREGQPYTPPNPARPKGFRKKTNKMCFRNTWQTVWFEDDDTYVEGYAVSSNTIAIPMHHAWAVTKEHGMIETTWAKSGAAYLGVPFEHETVSLVMRASGTYSVLEDIRNHFPILDLPWNEAEFQQRYRDILDRQRNTTKELRS
jgi:hypothetical protein